MQKEIIQLGDDSKQELSLLLQAALCILNNELRLYLRLQRVSFSSEVYPQVSKLFHLLRSKGEACEKQHLERLRDTVGRTLIEAVFLFLSV